MKQLTYRVVPAVLTDKTEHLERMLRQSEFFTDWVQVDIMDGLFVPSRSISVAEIAATKTGISWEAHLMVQKPMEYIDSLAAAGAKRVLVHYEAVKEEAQNIAGRITATGMDAGLVLNPETQISVLSDGLLAQLDSVLFMAVHPGYYGAKFIPEVLDKINSFRRFYPDMNVGIDGGVKPDNIAKIALSGANEICVGSAVFAQEDPAAAYHKLTELAGFAGRP
ncbi:MAG: ribulose-phosphate 3-epimerase [Dehalococcoidia bacterium]|nr:ribulose-phosphate 3-epimerase [Dehalococcoidia bacterium]